MKSLAKAVAGLSHPHITTVYEIGEEEGEPFIALEYIERECRRDKIELGPLKLGAVTSVNSKGSIIGTAAYMSPEQTRGEEIDHRVDIWSLGVVLYELVTGQLPLELERIVNKAMKKPSVERYQTLADMLIDLRSLRREFVSGFVRGKTPKKETWDLDRCVAIFGRESANGSGIL